MCPLLILSNLNLSEGGMLDEGVDNTIIQTSLRELEEEIGIPKEMTEVQCIL